MRKITFLCLILTSTFIYSQDCKYARNEVDEFTKNKVVETKSEWLAPNVGYSLKKINDSKFLRLEINLFTVFSIRDGAKLMFLTDHDEPITMLFPKYEISRVGSASNFYIVEYLELTADLIERFKNEKINKIRFYTTDGYSDRDIKEKRDKKFKELLKCIE
jgi:hypothetical protein